ncbi:autotransporter outer membrane beta-barrel domain-containing protein [Escherichia coli]|nr:autotransporter outer membrane beta-barrel domain-containing protein [Escherichia coli]EFK6880151.1 autotransporter outer membrane beta-barrel domain-containing protein [Escherichia coli]EIP4418661.1 autotransporter outer membrane beta-barrel domain-containing protein [Escherichia coli]EKE6968238.1 autotransporter outer membrane beta-barrel domain-containing protein [Escherichia coli]
MKFRYHVLAICISLSLSTNGFASTVRSDIAYQTYRDFAENKGVFQVGKVDIPIYDNKGKLVGRLNTAPMPDFSSVDSFLGVGTLIDPQHIVSVKHNGSYNRVSFGGTGKNPDYHRTSYLIVNRNNHRSRDFHVPRLNKLVTEVEPAVMTDAVSMGAYFDSQRFPVFYRIGTGTQYIKPVNGAKKKLHNAYGYLTGGTVGSPKISDWSFVSPTLDIYNKSNGALGNFGEGGDSGSPLFAWDTKRNTWVLVGVLDSMVPAGNRWTILQPDFIKNVIANENTDPAVVLNEKDKVLNWSFDSNKGTGVLSGNNGNNQSWTMHGAKGANLDAGKNLSFKGKKGTLNLSNPIDQGAGALTFETDYVVKSDNGSTWKGAGIIINKGVTVDWRVNGKANDNLHKIGGGTLLVRGKGKNPGGLNIGDGVAILNQEANADGKKQAFSTIDIVSGRPTVILKDADQIDPNKIYFGYRGGRLDINGNDISLARIKAVDNGAMIVNHNMDKAASVTLTGKGINNKYNDQAFLGFFGEKDSALTNGKLDIYYKPPVDNAFLALTGGANVNGSLNIEAGNVLLSGAPVLHAGNRYLDDWTPSGFNFSTINVAANKGLQIGQHTSVVADIKAAAGSHLTVGYNSGTEDKHKTRKCTLNDNTGDVNCTSPVLTDEQRNQLPPSSLTGDIKLAENGSLALGKAIWAGSLNADKGTVINMASDSMWQISKNSHAGSLVMAKGAAISFSKPANGKTGNTLTVQGDLQGEGFFSLNTRMADNVSDRVIVEGQASGNYILDVRNEGEEPVQDGRMLTLMSLNNPHQDFSKVNVTLAKGHVDIGTWRYRLTRDAGGYKLYNPVIPWTPLEPAQPDNPDIPRPNNPEQNQANWISYESNTAISNFTSHFNLLNKQVDSTQQHLSNLKPDESGLWFSYQVDELNYGNKAYRPYTQKLMSQSLGSDWALESSLGLFQFGGGLITTISHGSFDEGGRTNDRMTGVNLYGKLTLNSGAWFSGYTGFHYIDYNLKDASRSESSGKFGYIMGVGAGYQWDSPAGFTVQPQTGLNFYGLPSQRYSLNNKVNVSEPASHTVQYFAGLNISREMEVGGLPVSPYTQIMHKVNVNPQNTIRINNNNLNADYENNRTDFSLGSHVSLSDSASLNVKGNYTIGGGLKNSKDIWLEMKLKF